MVTGRGKGLAVICCKTALSPIKTRGDKLLSLITNTEQNRKFYTKNGFQEFAGRKLTRQGRTIGNWSFLRAITHKPHKWKTILYKNRNTRKYPSRALSPNQSCKIFLLYVDLLWHPKRKPTHPLLTPSKENCSNLSCWKLPLFYSQRKTAKCKKYRVPA